MNKAGTRHLGWVALGSGIGGMLRYGAVDASLTLFGPAWPVGTLTVNVVGSFLIGFLAGLVRPESRFYLEPHVRMLLMTGFCGGLTTFSFFSWQLLMFVAAGHLMLTVGYATFSVAAGMLAVWAGYEGGIRVSHPTVSRP
jgi:fluoride exporter